MRDANMPHMCATLAHDVHPLPLLAPACSMSAAADCVHHTTVIIQAMLDQYSVEDRRFQDLDRALGDAVQLMRVSDARVHNLRKMHAMVLLQQ